MTVKGRALVVGAVSVAIAAGGGATGRSETGPRGERVDAKTLRVAFATSWTTPDPALNLNIYFGQLEYAMYAKLLNYPDQPAPRGSRLVPEIAATQPTVSRDGKTFTFTIRDGFRFNTGVKVTAAHFAYALNRILDPKLRSPAAAYFEDIVGADDVLAGRASTATGIRASGRKLVITLRKRTPDFPFRMAMQYVCPLPLDYPRDPQASAIPPSAGPYYIAAWIPGQRVVVKRNPFYHGTRPHQFAEIVYELNVPLDVVGLQAERDETDYAIVGPIDYPRLRAKYGVNKRQLFVEPGIRVGYLALNTERPLFRGNSRLRRAVNFAIDRPALIETLGGLAGRATDQHLSPAVPGFIDARIYPLRAPNYRKARALARGHLRDGKAVLYTSNASQTALARAQIIQQNLRHIGLDVEIKVTRQPEPAFLRARGAPYDIRDAGTGGTEYPDPFAALNRNFDGALLRAENNTNVSFFNERKYNKKLAAAARLVGPARYRTYGKLDVELARDAAPAAAYFTGNWVAFFSRRIGCVKMNPVFGVSLGTLCLR
jgi:peptide/nickel transport system substrate-binding protein